MAASRFRRLTNRPTAEDRLAPAAFDRQATAQFDEGGCKGATVNDSQGNSLGSAQVDNTSGKLIFTDAETGEETEISGLEI